jgi:hypothetical protein
MVGTSLRSFAHPTFQTKFDQNPSRDREGAEIVHDGQSAACPPCAAIEKMNNLIRFLFEHKIQFFY